MAQKYTEARKDGNRKWDSTNLDRISIALQKGQKETVQLHASAHGESINAFVTRAIGETIARDKAGADAGAVNETDSLLTPETLERATKAAKVASEDVAAFITRAVETQAKGDETCIRMGMSL